MNESLLHSLSTILRNIQISPQWRFLVAGKENALNIGPIIQEGDPRANQITRHIHHLCHQICKKKNILQTYFEMDIILLKVDGTCELFLAAISNTCLQILQLDLHLLIISHGLFAFPPENHQKTFLGHCSLFSTLRYLFLHLPVYKDYDKNNKCHYGGSHTNSHLSLHRKSRLSLAVILYSAQREIQIPHFYLKSKCIHLIWHIPC